MTAPALFAKVLTVSDGVVAGTRVDTSGAALVELLTAHGFTVVSHAVVADGAATVAQELVRLTDAFGGVVVTTGGTGFAPRDQTPEGTRAVIEREAPGLAEAMRLVNPLGRLSRGIAGIRGGEQDGRVLDGAGEHSRAATTGGIPQTGQAEPKRLRPPEGEAHLLGTHEQPLGEHFAGLIEQPTGGAGLGVATLGIGPPTPISTGATPQASTSAARASS